MPRLVKCQAYVELPMSLVELELELLELPFRTRPPAGPSLDSSSAPGNSAAKAPPAETRTKRNRESSKDSVKSGLLQSQ